MKDSIFSGLEDLGFKEIEEVQLYKSEEEEKKEEQEQEIKKVESYLYDKSVQCPICGCEFKAKALKTSAYKKSSKDSDFFVRYALINPYFYDVWLCNSCGYAAMKSDFEKIRNFQIDLVKTNITPKWKGKIYSDIYDLDIGIERYKLSLLNYSLNEGKSSQKAMNCLKLAWMYRLSKDEEKEQIFLKNALKGFNDAYCNEPFPVYGMDKYTVMYLIGELYRRTYDYENALLWFSNLLTTPKVKPKLKDLARDQKDLIKELKSGTNDDTSLVDNKENYNDNRTIKNGLFSKFFK